MIQVFFFFFFSSKNLKVDASWDGPHSLACVFFFLHIKFNIDDLYHTGLIDQPDMGIL